MKIHKNGHFYVAGMVADGANTYEQAKQIFTDIQDLIKAAGGVMNDIMSMQIFLIDLNENQDIWRARQEFFSGDFPCSTLIQVSRVGSPKALPPTRVEINCCGYLGGSVTN
jgi:enamine deaminase RidA (YjgF/YER057c/UK114 family)